MIDLPDGTSRPDPEAAAGPAGEAALRNSARTAAAEHPGINVMRARGPSGERRKHCLARETDPAPAGFFLGGRSDYLLYVHRSSYCDIGGNHELPSKQMDCVGRSGSHPPDCSRRSVRLARRRDATSTVKHYSVLPGRLRASVSAISLPSGKLAFLSAHNDGAQRRRSSISSVCCASPARNRTCPARGIDIIAATRP